MWHRDLFSHVAAGKRSEATAKSPAPPLSSPPPLYLRLGSYRMVLERVPGHMRRS